MGSHRDAVKGHRDADPVAVGDLYPGANILGVDLSPIQPEWQVNPWEDAVLT
jgi:hypothetical protein